LNIQYQAALQRLPTIVILSILVSAVALVGLIASTHTAFASTDTYVISSSSMEPYLELNDIVVIDRDFPFEDVQVGEIILFNRPGDEDRTIVHRVISLDTDSEGNLVMTTKGDANPSTIPGTDYPITEDLYIGKVVSVVPKVGIITSFISPPVNYILAAGLWGGIIYALYRRSKRVKPEASNRDSTMQPSDVYNAAEKVSGQSKLAIKNAVPSQSIVAEGRRDFRWSWMIVGIIFAWPAAIAYYFTSKKNAISVTISPKDDGQGSFVNIQAIGRKARFAANEIYTKIK
jgi:signal peptidase